MARKSSRTRGDHPQSNTVLIVFLVFSILLNLALGVFLYLSQDKIDQAEKKETAAKTAQTGAENQRNAATKTLMPLLRLVIGDTTLTSDEINAMKDNLSKDIAVLPNDSTWYNGKIWKELMGRGQGDSGGVIGPFSEATGKPAISLIDKVRQLNEQLTKTMDKLKTAEANLAKKTAEYTDYTKKWNADNYAKDLKANQDAAEANKILLLKQKDEQLNVANQKTADTTAEVEKQFTENRKNSEKATAAVKADFDEKYRLIAEEQKAIKDRLQQDRITSLNVPKGHIVAYQPGTDMALIDLGSSVKLPIGLTFTVHERDAQGVASPQPKAEVQVVRLLGDQLAQVRITRMARPDSYNMPPPAGDMTPDLEAKYWDKFYTSDVRDFVRTNKPLFKGDLLFNVVWDPTRRTRVALVGDFDLNGDGTDDIQELIAFLRSQGADVDLYLDKGNSYKPKGKLDFATDLVVLGDVPMVNPRAALNQIATNRGTELIRESQAVQKEAIEKGIRIVQLPRFLNEIGINPPAIMKQKLAGQSPGTDIPPAATPVEKKDDAKPADPKPGDKPGQ
ncbi:MAG TPA: hypothetical protein PLN21_13590 [Gemmatales bacterium]|nr:hypothetical protein [Gemmatales bacterium]